MWSVFASALLACSRVSQGLERYEEWGRNQIPRLVPIVDLVRQAETKEAMEAVRRQVVGGGIEDVVCMRSGRYEGLVSFSIAADSFPTGSSVAIVNTAPLDKGVVDAQRRSKTVQWLPLGGDWWLQVAY